MALIQDVDKLKRKLRHEKNVHSILNTCFLSCQEQSRSGCARTEKARHWRWISWDVLLTYCSHMQACFALLSSSSNILPPTGTIYID
ncbi:uncharacterized protein LOC110270913 isoform X2 [Arachis ipaensis]|uniref:uncharacterized protein LOC110270913 isoform X2 n=1 Tax=Arachis ipaensis TaxID=130454 RepID=UPI000A2B6B85|nr:uncharacterized protein LOC110270913 isoform X2 [Arachis ipaensis]